jgi:predicted enzyme related to lactoylglutathione lyase
VDVGGLQVPDQPAGLRVGPVDLVVGPNGHVPGAELPAAEVPSGAVRARGVSTRARPGARFNFEVDDVDAWWRRLSAAADVVEPLFDMAYGTRKFTIRDPDGNELGFVQA